MLKQQLKEGIAVSVAPNELGEDVLHITVKGTGNVPAVTQMVDGINSLMKVAKSVPEDAAKVMEMALVAAGGAASIVMEVATEVAAQTEAGQAVLTKVNAGLETLGNIVGSVAAGSDSLDEFEQDVEAEEQHQDSDYYRSMQGGGNGVVVLVGMLAGVKKRNVVDGEPHNDSDESTAVDTSNQYIDIVSSDSRQHILHGDGPGSGGHIWPGQPGKSSFPESWNGDKIIHEIGDITTSPDTKWYVQTGNGGHYTKTEKPAKWVAWETRDGVRIRVVYEPATGKVVTGFPDNEPTPKLKTIE